MIVTLFNLVFPRILTIELQSTASFYHDYSAVARTRGKYVLSGNLTSIFDAQYSNCVFVARIWVQKI